MFMASFDFVACDLAYGSSLSYTYERDDGTVRVGLITFFVVVLIVT